mgnify:CR=1 FL=1
MDAEGTSEETTAADLGRDAVAVGPGEGVEVHAFCYESSSTTTTTVTLHSIQSTLSSHAIPGWMQAVHASHGMILVGGVAGCLRCGSIVSTRTPKLMKICEGRFKPDNKHRFQTLARGGLPRKFTEWPDGWEYSDDVRPVDLLRHTGSEWKWHSQVEVAVFTQMGRGRKSPACPRSRASWFRAYRDPYSA